MPADHDTCSRKHWQFRYRGCVPLTHQLRLQPISLDPANEATISESGKFRRYVVQDTIYEVKTYSYGSGGQQTSSRKIRNAEYLSNSGIVSAYL
jgi:hypothetical protein